MDLNELQYLQNLPLELKVAKTKLRIRDAIDRFGWDGLFVAVSGGKDSLCVHHLVKEVEEEYGNIHAIPRVFVDTGLEYPEVRENAIEIANEVLKPDMPFTKVIEKYGYPVISKQCARQLYDLRNPTGKNDRLLKLYKSDYTLDKDGNPTNKMNIRNKLSKKWYYLEQADFNISAKCCDVMKKAPSAKYKKQTGRIPILGVMAIESSLRTSRYIQDGGCNAFDIATPCSKPIGFWRPSDVLHYLYIKGIQLPSVYGEIKHNATTDEYYTTGVSRTGCVFCMFGVHLEKEPNRFQLMQTTHPKLYDYCMRGGKYNEEGTWVPHHGLGMKHVLKELNVPITKKSAIWDRVK